jgi:YD repeat-containing protein
VWGYVLGPTWGPDGKYRIVTYDVASTQPVVTDYDIFDRQLNVLTRNFADSNWLVEDWKLYDANGRAFKKYLTFEAGNLNPPFESMTYDSLGRLSTEVASNGATTTYTYAAQPNAGPVTTTAVNAKNQVTKHVRDVHGGLLQVIDANNKTTTYELTALGKLGRTTDSAGVQMSITYNTWGGKHEVGSQPRQLDLHP